MIVGEASTGNLPVAGPVLWGLAISRIYCYLLFLLADWMISFHHNFPDHSRCLLRAFLL